MYRRPPRSTRTDTRVPYTTLFRSQLRVKALESLLVEKGLVDPAALDEYVDIYETKVGPRNGAKVVARAWTDPEFLAWLRRDASAAIKSYGFEGRQGEHMVVVENTDREIGRAHV